MAARNSKTKKVVETNYCTMQLSDKCKNKEGVLPVGDFYTANSQFYVNGRFSICKNCLKEYVYEYNGDININKLKNIFRIYDIPFFEKEWESALNDDKDTIGVYFKNLYLNHKNQSWLDGDIQERDSAKTNTLGVADEDLIARWGEGWSISEMQWLERDYMEWLTHHDCEKLSIQKLVQMICIKELEIRNARQSGKATDKLEKSLMELMNSSNLTPRTMSAVNETDSSKIYGMWIKDIEQNKPAEYFKDKSIYKDYDNIKEYFDRFVLRPMKNLLIGSREFDKEFQSIEFGDDEIDNE